MVSNEVYEQCLPILEDSGLEEEDKTDKLEELLSKDTHLSGKALEDAILGVLWRHRDSTKPSGPSPHIQQSTFRRGGSPAPWQVSRTATPVISTPMADGIAAPGLGVASPALARTRSSIASPFVSPRPSPRLAFASSIPHSPNLNSYEFSEPGTQQNDYGDLGSDTVDWLVGEESLSRPSSSGIPNIHESTLSAAAAAWVQPQQTEMSPYDMLRSILGESKSDEEIEGALEANGYDLSTTIMMLMGGAHTYEEQSAAGLDVENHILIGKSMATAPIAINQQKQSRSNVVCKYWLSTGNCLRADCRFSHDLSSHICKYWVMGNCLAGDSCAFSHDPAALISNLNIENGNQSSGSSPARHSRPNFQIQDYTDFPTLQPGQTTWSQQNHLPVYQYSGSHGSKTHSMSSPHLSNASPRSYGSRPTSRHSSRAATPSLPAVDDTEAFPSLTASGKGAKKHQGKRGHASNHSSKDNGPISLADAIRMSPSPAPAMLRRGVVRSRSHVGQSDNGVAAQAIPAPEHIPWLETGDKLNHAYTKARQEAFKHGGMRNKFLQSAAQAWNRNDARAAKALSLRGQSENDLMRKAHREAARILYEDRNKNNSDTTSPSSSELYIDLHGLHPEEAVEYLARVLREQHTSSRPFYAITGTGHHSKNGKDKVGKALRTWLMDSRYTFREFSVPGDRGNVGGILGIDPRSCDQVATAVAGEKVEKEKNDIHEEQGGNAAATANTTTVTTAANDDGSMTKGAEPIASDGKQVINVPTVPKIR